MPCFQASGFSCKTYVWKQIGSSSPYRGIKQADIVWRGSNWCFAPIFKASALIRIMENLLLGWAHEPEASLAHEWAERRAVYLWLLWQEIGNFKS